MAVNFTKEHKDNNIEIISLEKINEERENNSLEKNKKQFEIEIRNSGVIDTITSRIDINNTTSIVEFGKEPAMKMASIADQVLSKYSNSTFDDTGKLVDSLLKVMKQIDIGEIKSLQELSNNRPKGIFEWLKGNVKDKLNRLVEKYKGISSEIEKICQQLYIYEQQIKDSNRDIAKMYDASVNEYKSLVEVILAGEQACLEIENYVNSISNDDLESSLERRNAEQALELMRKRLHDLKASEALALQSIPTFKIQEYTNANLARKVNSAFIVTIPAFKSALVNSIIAKQQSIQAQGLSALDEATSQLIRKNADNVVKQLELSQKLASTSAIKVEDIEYSFNTIMNGITKYKEMEVQYAEIRKQEELRIKQLNEQCKQQINGGNFK